MRNTHTCRPFCTFVLVNHRQIRGEASIQIIKRFPVSYRIQQLYCHIHSTNPLAVKVIKLNPVRSHTSHSFKPHFNIILPCMPGPSNWSLPCRFHDENFVCIFTSPMRATCSANLTPNYLSTLTVSVEMCCVSL